MPIIAFPDSCLVAIAGGDSSIGLTARANVLSMHPASMQVCGALAQSDGIDETHGFPPVTYC